MTATIRTYWFILGAAVNERLTYRGDFAFATLMRFLPIVTQIFLWRAVFAGSPTSTLNNYTFDAMIAYYLLAMISRAFSSMPGLSSGIAREIRDGTVKKYLTQPVDMLGYLFWSRVAHKLVYYLVAAGPFALVFYLCRAFFTISTDWFTVSAFVAALGMAFLIGFLIESLVGLIAFWFLEVQSLVFIFMMLNYFLSGHMIPLDWFPAGLRDAISYLPFQYLAYFPAAVLLGRFPAGDLVLHLSMELAWVVVLWIANRAVFARGVRQYSAYGG